MIRSDNLSVMCYTERYARPLIVGWVHFIPNSSDLPTTSFFLVISESSTTRLDKGSLMRMNPRLVDWLLLGLVLFKVISWLGIFLVDMPAQNWFFTLRVIVRFFLVVVLVWKIIRRTPRIVPKRPTVFLSRLAFGLAVLALGADIVWGMGPIFVILGWYLSRLWFGGGDIEGLTG